MPDREELARIRAWLDERGPEIESLLEELVRAESPTDRPDLQGPVFDLLESHFAEAGLPTRRLSGRRSGGQLLARPGKGRRVGGPFQLVIGHVDTVWPVGTLAEMPVARGEGRMTGPGVFDMKSGLALLAYALRALRALELRPALDLVVFLNSDEEEGSGDSESRIRLLARRADRALVLEPALGADGKLKTARRGMGRFHVRVRGRSAHSGMDPGEGASAIQEMSHLVQGLHALADPERGISVNVGRIEGGTRANVVAAEATAEVDARISRSEDAAWLEERIAGLAAAPPATEGTRVEIHGCIERLPMERSSRNQALWRAAQEVGRAMGLELEQETSGGASDGNITTELTATLDGLGAVGDGAHAVHEHVVTERLTERATLLAGILLLPALGSEAEG